jgi:hypothetical protein
MHRLARLVVLVALAATARAAGAAPAAPEPSSVPATLPSALRVAGPLSTRVVRYRIEADLDVVRHVIIGREHVTWHNTRADAARELKFHLYMNAFKNEASVFMREAEAGEGRLVRSPEKWGTIDVKSVKLGEAELRPQAVVARCPEDEPDVPSCPRDETVMDVPLPTPVPPGGTVELDIDFEVQLPEIVERTGYHGTFHMVGQWFPKLGVFEDAPGGARWNCHAFHANSEFFADFGEYLVEITVPDGWVVGATGILAEERSAGGGRRTRVYHAEDVHDFAWTTDPDYLEARDSFEDVEIRLLYHPGSEAGVRRQLDITKAGLAFFGRVALPYPYRLLTVVEPTVRGLNAGGMEYPTLITTVPGFLSPSGVRMILEETTAHELGHQWFYGMIASNEFEEAWLDEGVNTWVTGLLLDELYGPSSSFELLGLQGSEVQATRRAAAYRPDFDPLETYAWRFAPHVYGTVYSKSAAALGTLDGYLGHERMLTALRAYAEANRFRHPRAQDFFDAFSKSSGEDLTWFFRPAFLGTEILDYEVSGFSSHRRGEPRGLFDRDGQRVEVKDEGTGGTPVYDTEVIVHRRGEFRFPVELEVTFRGGSRERVRWDGQDRWRRFTFATAKPAVTAVVDPDRKVLLDVNWLNNGRTLKPDRAPARRMRLGLAFWTQSLMQLVGGP